MHRPPGPTPRVQPRGHAVEPRPGPGPAASAARGRPARRGRSSPRPPGRRAAGSRAARREGRGAPARRRRTAAAAGGTGWRRPAQARRRTVPRRSPRPAWVRCAACVGQRSTRPRSAAAVRRGGELATVPVVVATRPSPGPSIHSARCRWRAAGGSTACRRARARARGSRSVWRASASAPAGRRHPATSSSCRRMPSSRPSPATPRWRGSPLIVRAPGGPVRRVGPPGLAVPWQAHDRPALLVGGGRPQPVEVACHLGRQRRVGGCRAGRARRVRQVARPRAGADSPVAPARSAVGASPGMQRAARSSKLPAGPAVRNRQMS